MFISQRWIKQKNVLIEIIFFQYAGTDAHSNTWSMQVKDIVLLTETAFTCRVSDAHGHQGAEVF